MKLSEIYRLLDLKVVNDVQDAEISGVCCGDLLSNVIASAVEGMAWVTVQCHLNIVAVARLKDLPLIIICQQKNIDEKIIRKASEEGIAIGLSEKSSFEVCGLMYRGLHESQG